MASGIPSNRSTSRATTWADSLLTVKCASTRRARSANKRDGVRFRGAGPAAGGRQAQRRQAVPGLPGHAERLAAGGQDPQVVGGGQQSLAQFRHRGQHVLAVIEHQQQLLPGQRRDQRIRYRRAWNLVDTQGRSRPPRAPAPGLTRWPARLAIPRRRTGRPSAAPPVRPLGSCRPHRDRSPSRAGASPASRPARPLRPRGRRSWSGARRSRGRRPWARRGPPASRR